MDMNAQLQEVVFANSSFTSVPSGLLQRKCACGNHTISSGECEKCLKDKQTLQHAPSWNCASGMISVMHEDIVSEMTASTL
jgi:hypothetical protein